jgi:hypothetical protein
MSSLNSLTDLLQESGVKFGFFDMGRHITELPSTEFAQIEQGNCIYPSPYLHQAWLALMLWNPENSEQNIVWFLKFPLDEQGFLVQAVRDDFINRLMLNINQILESADISEAEDALKDNPFSFTPDQEKMAVFHAITAKQTKAEPSQFYQPCLQYYSAQTPLQHWQELGLQGIAELAINIADHQDIIINHFDQYPDEPLIALCNSLEHSEISELLSTKIIDKLTLSLALEQPNIALCNALARATYASSNENTKQQAVLMLLNSKLAHSSEVLSTIAIKLSKVLLIPDVCHVFLEKLAISEAGQQGFSRILADLMFSEDLRQAILSAFRNPKRSDELTKAIGSMFGSAF